MRKSFLSLIVLLFLASCTGDQSIVNNVEERDANEIIVFLASKGIAAQKIEAVSSGAAATNTTLMFNISVPQDQSTQAMALLNQYGLPRRQGTTLLTLFAGTGLVATDREQTIRYQAGLAEELSNTIRKMDGVLDANVQISFPPAEANATPGAVTPKITAAVYVKHQGILEDPNSHMEIKIKRLMAGSVNGLSFDDVSVISDRARIADITLQPDGEPIGPKSLQDAHAKIWGVVMTKGSLLRFRFIFFFMIFLMLLMAAAIGWLVYKFYPLMRKNELPNQPPPPAG